MVRSLLFATVFMILSSTLYAQTTGPNSKVPPPPGGGRGVVPNTRGTPGRPITTNPTNTAEFFRNQVASHPNGQIFIFSNRAIFLIDVNDRNAGSVDLANPGLAKKIAQELGNPVREYSETFEENKELGCWTGCVASVCEGKTCFVGCTSKPNCKLGGNDKLWNYIRATQATYIDLPKGSH